jgi:hypothetical protein
MNISPSRNNNHLLHRIAAPLFLTGIALVEHDHSRVSRVACQFMAVRRIRLFIHADRHEYPVYRLADEQDSNKRSCPGQRKWR